METFVKIGFAKISLAAQKNLSCPKFGRGRGGGAGAGRRQPPAPPARTLMGAITCFFMQTHYNFSQI